MLVSGCANSILNKLQDNTCVENCDGPPKEREHFEQPVFQTVQMFVAEGCCWLIYLFMKHFMSYKDYQTVPSSEEETSTSTDNSTHPSQPPPLLSGKRLILLAGPAFFDICGTTLMNIGLLYVPVSIYQMIRGALVLFVGFMSIIFLKRKVTVVQWWGLTTVTFGVFIVGLSARYAAQNNKKIIAEGLEKTPWEVTLGIFMVLFAQVFTASQFVVEEYILNKWSLAPIKVVSWEGTFGTGITVIGSMLIYTILHGNTAMFNLLHALRQVFNSSTLFWAGIAIMISIASFNYCGLSVTKQLSATSRSTIDTCRTIGIWFVSFLLGWESFQFLQLFGFGLLVYGTMMVNGVVHVKENKRDEQEAS